MASLGVNSVVSSFVVHRSKKVREAPCCLPAAESVVKTPREPPRTKTQLLCNRKLSIFNLAAR